MSDDEVELPANTYPRWREALDLRRRVLLLTNARDMGLLKRVPELMRTRGWPVENQDLLSVLIAAVVCKEVGAGRQAFKRPPGAEVCGWLGEASRTASQIVASLNLGELLK